MQRPVVGVDGSDSASAALRWVSSESDPGAEIHVLSAVSPVEGLGWASVEFDWSVIVESYRAQLEGEWTEDLRRSGADVVTHLLEDEPGHALVTVADEVDADVIVAGRHGHSKFLPRTLGHVGHYLIVHSSRPVVIVDKDNPTPDGPVIVGVGPAGSTHNALVWAVRWAAAKKRSLVAATVLEPMPIYSDYTMIGGPADVPVIDYAKLQESALERLDQIVSGLCEREGIEVDYQVAAPEGFVGEVLADMSSDASLVVLGHHRGGKVLSVLGTAVHHVTTHAEAPVAVIPESDEG